MKRATKIVIVVKANVANGCKYEAGSTSLPTLRLYTELGAHFTNSQTRVLFVGHPSPHVRFPNFAYDLAGSLQRLEIRMYI